MEIGTYPERQGDDAVIARLIPTLRAFARGFHRQRSLADGLVAETFTNAAATIDNHREGASEKGWLLATMRTIHDANTQDTGEPQGGELPAPIGDPAQSPSARLWEAIHELPLPQREVLILVEVLGLPLVQTAQICACTEVVVRDRLRRAREGLGISPEPTLQIRPRRSG